MIHECVNVSDPISYSYKEAFQKGSRVQISDRPLLENFMTTWKYRHKLRPEQFEYADQLATIEDPAFYHGGDPLHKLAGIPGLWLEQC